VASVLAGLATERVREFALERDRTGQGIVPGFAGDGGFGENGEIVVSLGPCGVIGG